MIFMHIVNIWIIVPLKVPRGLVDGPDAGRVHHGPQHSVLVRKVQAVDAPQSDMPGRNLVISLPILDVVGRGREDLNLLAQAAHGRAQHVLVGREAEGTDDALSWRLRRRRLLLGLLLMLIRLLRRGQRRRRDVHVHGWARLYISKE